MKTKTTILQSIRSPMNPKRFLVLLSCHHEQWVTSARKPKEGSKRACELEDCVSNNPEVSR